MSNRILKFFNLVRRSKYEDLAYLNRELIHSNNRVMEREASLLAQLASKDQALYDEEIRREQAEFAASKVNQGVPAFYAVFCKVDSKWIPMPQFCGTSADEVREKVSAVLMHADFQGSIPGWFMSLGWNIFPVYTHPAEPKPSTAIEDYLKEIEACVFEKWLAKETPSGDAESIHAQWVASEAYFDVHQVRAWTNATQ